MARTKGVVRTDDLQVGYDLGRAPEELREAGVEIEDIEIVPAHQMRTKAQDAKFMEEKVLVEIEADDDPNAPVFVYSGHNGVMQYIERGKPQAIRRKYLYSLLMAKQVKMACAFGKDANGNEFNRLTPNGKTTHRVVLIRDDNPLGGMKWFQSVTSNAR